MANANLGRNLGRNFAILRYSMQLIGGTGLVWVLVVHIKDFCQALWPGLDWP